MLSLLHQQTPVFTLAVLVQLWCACSGPIKLTTASSCTSFILPARQVLLQIVVQQFSSDTPLCQCAAGLHLVCKLPECARARVCIGRESERMEFADAKDRLKHSWAADREDFARVKEQLKKKNAEHHVQNGRLSQSLKVHPVTDASG